jgi:glycosyltransferase involved in cell wall biosynthesis
VKPLVTIGIPTFDRSPELGRALDAVVAQDYPNLEVLVADNASPGDDTRRVVDLYRSRIRALTYTKHLVNMGPLRNFAYLVDQANGTYFMWLADDDEISADYVSALVDILEANPTASSAAGHWILVGSDGSRQEQRTSSYPQSSAIERAIRFVWRTDDAFFYALHRTDTLRQASFGGYVWPNRDVLINWAYVFLFDMVLRGRVLLATDPSVQFINHEYTSKAYLIPRSRAVGRLSGAMRRLNVHALYWKKAAEALHPALLPLLMVTSACALARDGAAPVLRRVARLLA